MNVRLYQTGNRITAFDEDMKPMTSFVGKTINEVKHWFYRNFKYVNIEVI